MRFWKRRNPWKPAPKTIDEALEAIPRILGPEQTEKLRTMTKEDLINLHWTLNLSIRNWWLAERGPLYQELRARFIVHFDEMSSYITDSVWLKLNGLPVPYRPAFTEKQLQYMVENGIEPRPERFA